EQRIAKLQGDLGDARRQADDLSAQQRATQAFVTDTYPELMANRLRGKSVALVFLGPADAHVRASLEQMLADAGASGWVRVRALKLPLDVQQIDDTLAGDPALARYVGGARPGRRAAAARDSRAWLRSQRFSSRHAMRRRRSRARSRPFALPSKPPR